MSDAKLAYELRVLFERKITAPYYDSFKGKYGRTQVEVLNYLYDNDAAGVQKLAQTLNIPKQHASKIVGRLKEEGLLLCREDPKDRRALRFSLSPEGKHLMELHIADSNHRFKQCLEALEERERRRFRQAMEAMVEILEIL